MRTHFSDHYSIIKMFFKVDHAHQLLLKIPRKQLLGAISMETVQLKFVKRQTWLIMELEH